MIIQVRSRELYGDRQDVLFTFMDRLFQTLSRMDVVGDTGTLLPCQDRFLRVAFNGDVGVNSYYYVRFIIGER